MSTVAILLIAYLLVSLTVMLAFCRAAARGDRVMDGSRRG